MRSKRKQKKKYKVQTKGMSREKKGDFQPSLWSILEYPIENTIETELFHEQ